MIKKLMTLSLVVFCGLASAEKVDFSPVKRGFGYIIPKMKRSAEAFNARRFKAKRDEAFAFTQLATEYGKKLAELKLTHEQTLAALKLAHEQALNELHDKHFKANEEATTAELNEKLKAINDAYTAAKAEIKAKYPKSIAQVVPANDTVETVIV
jgi:hypothetical protein